MKLLRRSVCLLVALVLAGLHAPWPGGLVRALAPARELLTPPRDTVFVDRSGRVLRHLAVGQGPRGDWQPLGAHPEMLVRAVLAAEDMRFREHAGVDVRAIARAGWDNLRAGRIVSGASTVSQQTVRLLEPRARTWRAKAWEALRALALDRSLSKDEILEQYLNRAPMPGMLRGMAAGARMLLDRELGELTLSECAWLAALPQAPGRLDPRKERGRARLEKRRLWVLERMLALGWASAADVEKARAQAPVVRAGRFPFRAPHFVDRMAGALGREAGVVGPEAGVKVVKTTLDLGVQSVAEEVLGAHRARLLKGGARQAACVILDTETREVRAWVGSMGWDARCLGFNDGVVARRSAGSTLKPFVYAVALEKGMTLATPLADVRRSFATPRGDYDPRNYDRREHGPVLARAALGASLNAAAVEVARRVGPGVIADRLRALSLLEPKKDARDLGVGIAIGNVEVTLIDLAAAYATLVSGGRHRPPVMLAEKGGGEERALLDPAVAYMVTDALCDPAPRLLTFGDLPCFEFPFPVAAKTGTSTGYRDAWAVGATPRFVVATWAGNFDGGPTAGLAGATAAAPLMHDVLIGLHRGQVGRRFARPAGVVEREVCADSGDEPGAACPRRLREMFVEKQVEVKSCAWHQVGAGPATFVGPQFAGWLADREVRGLSGRHVLAAGRGGGAGSLEITYPHAGDRFVVSRSGRSVEVMVSAVPAKSVPYLRWFLDGDEQESTPPPYRWSWTLTRGSHKLMCTSPDLSASAVVDVQVE